MNDTTTHRRTRGAIPVGGNADARDAAAENAARDLEQLKAELAERDAELERAGTPGLRLLQPHELKGRRKRYGRYANHAVPMAITTCSSVPELLAHLPEFVQLTNERRAVQDAAKRIQDDHKAWRESTERAKSEWREAVTRAATYGEEPPPKPELEPWQYDADADGHTYQRLMNDFQTMVEIIDATERGVLKENGDTYVSILQHQASDLFDRKNELLRQLALVDAELGPREKTIERLKAGPRPAPPDYMAPHLKVDAAGADIRSGVRRTDEDGEWPTPDLETVDYSPRRRR